MAKVWSPLDLSLDFGTARKAPPEESKAVRWLEWGQRLWDVTLGETHTGFKSNQQTPKRSILKRTGSQCKAARTRVMWLRLFKQVRSLAAAFWTSWRYDNDFCLKPVRRELEHLTWKNMNPWITFSKSVAMFLTEGSKNLVALLSYFFLFFFSLFPCRNLNSPHWSNDEA